MRDTKITDSFTYRYDNVNNYFSDAIAQTDSRSRSSRQAGNRGWAGSDSWDITEQRYRTGYPEGTAKARELALRLTPFLRTVKGQRRGFKASMHAGGNFLIDNYNRGLPECCSVMQPVVSKKFASLILNGTASCGVGVDVMQRRGIAALALAQVLEQNGYRVSIKLCYGESYKAKQFVLIDLKPFHQSIELDRLAFFLSDPSAFRRLQFSWMETRPAEERAALGVDPDCGYGRPIDLSKSEIGDKDIYLGCASYNDSHWRSLETAQAWIKESLKRYGVEFYG